MRELLQSSDKKIHKCNQINQDKHMKKISLGFILNNITLTMRIIPYLQFSIGARLIIFYMSVLVHLQKHIFKTIAFYENRMEIKTKF